MNLIRYFSAILIIGSNLLIASSCKKEMEKMPYAEIESFSITDGNGNKLYAAIKDDEIIVYWNPPTGDFPSSVTPEIVVSEGATISPASGTPIPFNESTIYTVKAQNGTVKSYKLVPGVNQAIIIVSSVSSNLIIGQQIQVRGEFFIADTSKTKLFLVSGNNIQIPVPMPYLTKTFANGYIPMGIDTGYYKIKLASGERSYVSPTTYRVGPPLFTGIIKESSFTEIRVNPDVGLKVGTVKRGGSLVFQLSEGIEKYYSSITNVIMETVYVNLTTFETIQVSATATQSGNLISVKIPDDIPIGSIIPLTYSLKFGDDKGFQTEGHFSQGNTDGYAEIVE